MPHELRYPPPMFVTGLGLAVPSHAYTQRECWEAIQAAPQFNKLTARSRAILKKVLTGDNGITTRHFALKKLDEAFGLTPDVLHARFLETAPALATQAAERALADSGIELTEIGALLVSTCTGYLCPGLTSYVIERLGLRPDVLALDLVGQGCGAAIPNWRSAESLLAGGRCEHALSICVEVCSAALYLDDDPGVLISACLFGDGAGAAILSASPKPERRRVESKCAASLIATEEREQLRFEQRGGMLRNILRPEVPACAAQLAGRVLGEALNETGLDKSQIGGWILHPGGRDVLAALGGRIGLSDSDLRFSAGVLRDFGNLSSPSVLFVLERALADGLGEGYWWMSSFGAGFSCHGVLLEVGPALPHAR